ncbi:hypothetical protein ACWGNA_13295 [Brucella cytisi]|uniref:hypothetical protein n=1 Tax=Brucella cytisi TaxID=407152 RepID=UPI0035D6238C
MLSKSDIDLACRSLQFAGKLNGWSQTEIDLAIMSAARDKTMPRDGRAEAHLRHYLLGSGLPKTFGAHLLINEDPGVRARLTSSISATLANNLDPVTGRVNPGIRGKVWLRQQPMDFRNRDWLFAIGSFLMEWEFVNEFVGQTGLPIVTVRVHGQNEYQWHPDAPRRTQCVHQAAERLQKPLAGFTAARNYMMVASPALLYLPKPNPRGKINVGFPGIQDAIPQ